MLILACILFALFVVFTLLGLASNRKTYFIAAGICLLGLLTIAGTVIYVMRALEGSDSWFE